jgi:GNAT superfamily N-acetyltransferase
VSNPSTDEQNTRRTELRNHRLKNSIETKLFRENMIKLQDSLDRFLADTETRNLWLRTRIAKVYVRKSVYERKLPDIPLSKWNEEPNCLDVATVEVYQKYQGKGVFTRFMAYALKVSPYENIILECVMNPILVEWANRHGWTKFNQNCYVLKRNELAP